MPATPEELGAAAFVGAVLVSIPVAAGLTYLDSKRHSNHNSENEGEKKDAPEDRKGGK